MTGAGAHLALVKSLKTPIIEESVDTAALKSRDSGKIIANKPPPAPSKRGICTATSETAL
jgi:hypothetical protein